MASTTLLSRQHEVRRPGDSFHTEALVTPLATKRRIACLCISALLVVVVPLVRGITAGEFDPLSDEPTHAATGLFFADFFFHMPLAHPVSYTYLYYAQYPALGLIHWPPLFHLVEGVFFLAFGPSTATARLAVLFFALLGCFAWFQIVRRLQNSWAAAVSTALLGVSPGMLGLERAVMLEIPSLSLCLAAIYFWIDYLKSERSRPLYCFALLTGLALLTKQQSAYLLLFCLLTLLAQRKWALLFRANARRALVMSLLLLAPFYVLSLAFHWQTVSRHIIGQSLPGMSAFTYYPAAIPQQLGWPVLLLSALGIVTAWWWDRRENAVLMLLWLLACYLTLSFLSAREPRYSIYWIPPWVYFAVAPLFLGGAATRRRVAGAIAGGFLLLTYVLSAWRNPRPLVAGYEALAQTIAARDESGGLLLFDGEGPADFIFYLRASDPGRRYVVLRKALYVTRITKEFGSAELIQTRDELERLIDGYGIRYIVISEMPAFDFDIQKTLREVLASPRFKLVKKVPIESSAPRWKGRNLLLYENDRVAPRTERTLTLRMLTLDWDIVVPLEDLGIRRGTSHRLTQ
ncbi:MAG: hypothetical protein DMG30_07810 [Acidobacteria bacterium]|nr:MAG: hypothetical protein DMG30_07810 [Acidobacteriota bacterium]